MMNPANKPENSESCGLFIAIFLDQRSTMVHMFSISASTLESDGSYNFSFDSGVKELPRLSKPHDILQ
jgi:hypothetical protein